MYSGGTTHPAELTPRRSSPAASAATSLTRSFCVMCTASKPDGVPPSGPRTATWCPVDSYYRSDRPDRTSDNDNVTPSTQTPARIGARQANRARLREDLLDAAEELFADGGYYGVSVRDITERAGTRLAAVSDHFGGKENLLRDVLRRRVEPLNAERRRSLGELSGLVHG